MHFRQLLKVVDRRWRRGSPFQCPGVPGIVACDFSLPIRDYEVVREDQDRYSLNQSPDRDNQIQEVPSTIRLIGVDRPGHPQKPKEMHRVKGDVEADCKQPEMPLPECLVHQPSCRFWIPVIDASEDAEHDGANKHVVEVSDNEVRIMKLPIPWRYREHDAGKPGDEELEEESNAEQHRSCETYSAAP